jgi:hemoglobin
MRNAALIVILVSAQAAAGQDGEAGARLYERLGGWDNVERIVHDTIALHRENPKIARHFADVDVEALQKHVTAFFAAGTGGPNTYAGRDMASTHAGMGLSDADFNAAVADVLKACEMNGAGEQERSEVAAILESLRPSVMAETAL